MCIAQLILPTGMKTDTLEQHEDHPYWESHREIPHTDRGQSPASIRPRCTIWGISTRLDLVAYVTLWFSAFHLSRHDRTRIAVLLDDLTKKRLLTRETHEAEGVGWGHSGKRQWPRHCLKAHRLGVHGRGMWLYRKSHQFCCVHLCAAVSGISTAVHMMTNPSRSWPGKI